MRIGVFGAGAIGGHLAAKLASAGHDVSAVARGPNLDALRARGIALRHGERTFSGRVRASDRPANLGAQDVVFVTTKATGLGALAEAAAPLSGPDTLFVFVQNGIPWWYAQGLAPARPQPPSELARLDPDGRLARAVAPERVIGAVVYSSNDVVEPGVHTPDRNMLVLCEPGGRTGPRLDRLRGVLEEVGMLSPPTADIREVVWNKLLINFGSSLCVALGDPIGAVLADPALRAARERPRRRPRRRAEAPRRRTALGAQALDAAGLRARPADGGRCHAGGTARLRARRRRRDAGSGAARRRGRAPGRAQGVIFLASDEQDLREAQGGRGRAPARGRGEEAPGSRGRCGARGARARGARAEGRRRAARGRRACGRGRCAGRAGVCRGALPRRGRPASDGAGGSRARRARAAERTRLHQVAGAREQGTAPAAPRRKRTAATVAMAVAVAAAFWIGTLVTRERPVPKPAPAAPIAQGAQSPLPPGGELPLKLDRGLDAFAARVEKK